jgi:hypothetical protein
MYAADEQRWTLDRTISANTVIQLGTIIIAIIGGWYGLRSDISLVDARVNSLMVRLEYEQAGDRRLFDEIRRGLERIENKIDGKADKPTK